MAILVTLSTSAGGTYEMVDASAMAGTLARDPMDVDYVS